MRAVIVKRQRSRKFRFGRFMMHIEIADDIKIVNTTKDDLDTIFWLFEQAMELQGKNGYKVGKELIKLHYKKI